MIWLTLYAALAAAPRVHTLSYKGTHVFVLEGEDGVVLVDTALPSDAPAILQSLEDMGIADVDLILLTHAHQDHAGSAAELARVLGAPVAVGAADRELLGQGDIGLLSDYATGTRGRIVASLLDPTFPPLTPDRVIDHRLELAEYGVDAFATVVGGHSPGSLVVSLPDGTLLVGDLIRSHFVRQHKPTLHLFHTDGLAAHNALRALLEDESVTTVLPAHGGALDADRVRRWLARRAPRHEARWARQEERLPL